MRRPWTRGRLGGVRLTFARSARRVTAERLGWTLRIRGAVIAVFLVLALAARLAGALPSVVPAAVGGGLGVVMNLTALLCVRRWRRIPAVIVWTGVGDAVIITGVVAATGGAASPFVFLYVVQVVTAAFVVDLAAATIGGGLGIALLGAVVLSGGLPGAAPPVASSPTVRFFAFALTVLFLLFIGGWLTRRLTRGERELERAHQRIGRSLAGLRAAHAALQDAYARLADAEARLVASEKTRALGVLVAGLAHELGNPLSVLAGNLVPLAERLERGTRDHAALADLARAAAGAARDRVEALAAAAVEDRRETEALLANCREAAARATGLLGQLRSFGAGGVGAALRPTSLRDAVEGTLALVRHRLPRGVHLHRAYTEVGPVASTPSELNQVVMNLLLNAADALAPEGNLWLTVAPAGAWIELVVADDGVGVGSEALPRLFDPFYTTKDPGKGTGLGLAVSRAIVDRHGGRLDAGHRPGGGTVFTLRLRAA